MASGSVSVNLAVEGGKSFQNELKAADSACKAAAAGLKELNTAFDSNDSASKKAKASMRELSNILEAQKAKGTVIANEYKKQQAALDELAVALQKAKEENGEGSAEALKAADAYNQQAKKVNDLETQLRNNNAAINETTAQMEEAKSASNSWKGALSGLASVAKTVGVATAAIATAAAGIAVKIGKEVVGAYGEFEQLEGGVKKIFGAEASQVVVSNARQAFSQVGVSANEYLETITGFSASLMQTMGGDAVGAATTADRAMKAMADNVNTYGSDFSSVQSAFQGFAKQNYSMLDNLRLGYGGTKAEMERLIKDASQMSDAQEKVGVSVDATSMSFENMINAIAVVQANMGIMDTTANEAMTTIQGSTNMLKASIQDLWSALGGSGQGVDEAMANIVTSFEYVVNNIKPVLMQIVAYIPEVVNALIPAVTAMLPELISAATQVFNGVLEALVGALPLLIPVATDALLTISDTLLANLPQIIDAAIQIIVSLVTGLANALPRLIGYVPTIISSIVRGLISNLPQIMSAAIQIIAQLIAGILSMAGQVINSAKNIGRNIWSAIKGFAGQMASAGRDLMMGLVQGIANAIGSVISAVVNAGKQILGAVKGVFGIASPSKETAYMGKMLMAGLAGGIDDNIKMVDKAWGHVTSDLMGMNAAVMGGTYRAGSTFNIYQREGENGAALARRINRQLGAVYE